MLESVLDGRDDFERSLGSILLDDLRGLGHDVCEIGVTERILTHAITD